MEHGQLVAPGGQYKVLVIPECHHVPEGTLKHILHLVRSGATVVSHGKLPLDVPGLANLSTRRAEVSQITRDLLHAGSASADTPTEPAGKFLQGDNLDELLTTAGVYREPLVDLGLKFVRRRDKDSWIYFIVNHSDRPINEYVPLSIAAQSVEMLDPMTAVTGKAQARSKDTQTEVLLDLQPRQSIILRKQGKFARAGLEIPAR